MKIKNLIIYFSVVIIVFFSLKTPDFLMKNLSKNIEKNFYKIEEAKTQIDVEAEKIYLVKAIHNIRSDSPTVTISSSDGEKITQKSKDVVYEISDYESEKSFPNIEKELKNLMDYNILSNLKLDAYGQFNIGIISKTYLNKNKYIVHNVLVDVDNTEIHFEIEDKTGKVIYAYFDKNLLSNISIKELLENFVKYLDLHIIKDWKYEEDLINKKYSLTSESAKLSVILNTSSEKYELTVRIKNWYNLETTSIHAWYKLMLF